MTNAEKLNDLANRFQTNLAYYKEGRNNYNEYSCRIEYIDSLLKILGWDVANERGLAPQYREVIAENYSTPTDRPDYTMTLRGVPKFFVEAKKPAVDITRATDPAFRQENTDGMPITELLFLRILNIWRYMILAMFQKRKMDVLWLVIVFSTLPNMQTGMTKSFLSFQEMLSIPANLIGIWMIISLRLAARSSR